MFLTIDFILSILGVGGGSICEYWGEEGKYEYFEMHIKGALLVKDKQTGYQIIQLLFSAVMAYLI